MVLCYINSTPINIYLGKRLIQVTRGWRVCSDNCASCESLMTATSIMSMYIPVMHGTLAYFIWHYCCPYILSNEPWVKRQSPCGPIGISVGCVCTHSLWCLQWTVVVFCMLLLKKSRLENVLLCIFLESSGFLWTTHCQVNIATTCHHLVTGLSGLL